MKPFIFALFVALVSTSPVRAHDIDPPIKTGTWLLLALFVGAGTPNYLWTVHDSEADCQKDLNNMNSRATEAQCVFVIKTTKTR
jgi:hypothetical protein